MKCGIADYTSHVLHNRPGGWRGVLSFVLEGGETPAANISKTDVEPVWHGTPGPRGVSASVILRGLKEIGCNHEDTVLWFQHEFNIWGDSQAFVDTLKGLDLPKVVTLHTLHFQSRETPTGLCQREHDLLRALLSHVDAITVFSHGVYSAVVAAFPQHRGKVHVIKHGVRSYPEISRLSHKEAKEALSEFLLCESDLDRETKRALREQRVFIDPDTVVLGQTGYLHPMKGSEFLSPARDELQKLVPHRRVVAVRIGTARLEAHLAHADEIRRNHDGKDRFLLDLWLPQRVLPLAQRAFDVNYYWPNDCTQSGVLTHALGAGAIIAGRDLEGVGETLKQAGALCDRDPANLLLRIRDIIVKPGLGERIEQSAANYAARFSWKNQAARHSELAEHILSSLPVPASSNAIVRMARRSTSLTRWIRAN